MNLVWVALEAVQKVLQGFDGPARELSFVGELGLAEPRPVPLGVEKGLEAQRQVSVGRWAGTVGGELDAGAVRRVRQELEQRLLRPGLQLARDEGRRV